jgi:hypothetical protein
VKGLSFRKTSDAIAAFVKQHGAATPRRAVLCTYDLDPRQFEAALMPEFHRRRRWFRTLVLADAATLQKQGVLGQRGAASAYELAPVRVNGPGVFHPKLILLQAGPHVLVGIGSGNLTPGGLGGGNLELMLFAGNETADGAALAASAFQFLHDLRTSRRVTLPDSARRFLERVSTSAATVAPGPILHSLESPLIEQLPDGRPSRVARVAVVSPWHSTATDTDGVEPDVVAKVGQALGAHPRVYTQGQAGKAPSLGKKTEVRILRTGAYGGDEDLDTGDEQPEARPRRPARLHAKAYLAVGATNATLWFGSANCTMPALCRVAGQGNVELLVRVSLDRNALARIDADLGHMFEKASGSLPPGATPRIPAARGRILAGYVENWDGAPKLTIELTPSARAARLRIGHAARAVGTIEIPVSRDETSVVLSAEQSRRLFREGDVPVVLWEHIGRAAVPFPISVSCVPSNDDPEDVLQEALDDLAGRVPIPFRKRATRPDDEGEDDDDDRIERDRELELLTASEHEGMLDRTAVRVELLRRRLSGMPAARAHYVGLLERLALPASLRRILGDHLGAEGTAR